MKQLLLGLVATFAFGSAVAQSVAPATPAIAAPAAQSQEAQTDTAMPTSAEPVFVETAQVPTTPVVNTAPKVSPALISAGVAAGLVGIALATAGDDDNDRPSSP